MAHLTMHGEMPLAKCNMHLVLQSRSLFCLRRASTCKHAPASDIHATTWPAAFTHQHANNDAGAAASTHALAPQSAMQSSGKQMQGRIQRNAPSSIGSLVSSPVPVWFCAGREARCRSRSSTKGCASSDRSIAQTHARTERDPKALGQEEGQADPSPVGMYESDPMVQPSTPRSDSITWQGQSELRGRVAGKQS